MSLWAFGSGSNINWTFEAEKRHLSSRSFAPHFYEEEIKITSSYIIGRFKNFFKCLSSFYPFEG
jgi:hypothetical protein